MAAHSAVSYTLAACRAGRRLPFTCTRTKPENERIYKYIVHLYAAGDGARRDACTKTCVRVCVRERVRALLSAGADAAAGARVLLYDAVRRRVL